MRGPTTLADYLSVLRGRKWLILAVAGTAAVAAFVVAQSRAQSYQAHATVLVNRSSGVVSGITGAQDPTTSDPLRFMATQANIARAPELAARVVKAAGVPGVTADGLLRSSSVTPNKDADLLDVSVSSPKANDAVTLANAYALEFTRYKTELDTARINDALRVLRTRAAKLLQQNGTGSTAYQSALQYEGQLLTIGALVANGTSVLKPAEGAAQVGRNTRRDVILGILLGAVLGLALAFLVEALDPRVRAGDEIDAILGLPLLGRIARPPRIADRKALVMLAEPKSPQAEAFRKLRTSIELANRERQARTIMFTSAEGREGKSTTAANVAIAFACKGSRVALVDLDVRRPSIHSLFHVSSDHGITDVVANHENAVGAIQQVALRAAPLPAAPTSDGQPTASSSSTNGRSDLDCVLHVLPCGTRAADAEFLESERVSAVLSELGEAFDIVLVDAPPLLAGAGTINLSTKVDAIVVVTHLGIQRPLLQELRRQLEQCRAVSLGYILTGIPRRQDYGERSGYFFGSADMPPSYEVNPKLRRRRQSV